MGKEAALLSPRRRHQPKSGEPRPWAGVSHAPVRRRRDLEVSRWETHPCTPQNTASGRGIAATGRVTPGAAFFPLALARTPRQVSGGFLPSPPARRSGGRHPAPVSRRRGQTPETERSRHWTRRRLRQSGSMGPGPEGSFRMLRGAVTTRGGGASLTRRGREGSTCLRGRGVSAQPPGCQATARAGLTVGGAEARRREGGPSGRAACWGGVALRYDKI